MCSCVIRLVCDCFSFIGVPFLFGYHLLRLHLGVIIIVYGGHCDVSVRVFLCRILPFVRPFSHQVSGDVFFLCVPDFCCIVAEAIVEGSGKSLGATYFGKGRLGFDMGIFLGLFGGGWGCRKWRNCAWFWVSASSFCWYCSEAGLSGIAFFFENVLGLSRCWEFLGRDWWGQCGCGVVGLAGVFGVGGVMIELGG